MQRLIDLGYKWYPRFYKNINDYYIQCNQYIGEVGNKKHITITLHQFLMNNTNEFHVDHINHNTLDNRKENLRLVEVNKNTKNRKSKNKNNKSGYRNVFWSTANNKWLVTLCDKRKSIYIGLFNDVHEAGKAAEEARQKYYGDFAGGS